MADSTMNEAVIQASGTTAERMLATAMRELRESTLNVQDAAGDKFFPNGIELIKLTVTVGKVAIEFKVSGEKGVSGLTDNSIEMDINDSEKSK